MRLEHPGDFLTVVLPRAAEKFQRKAADDIFLAVHVGASEAAGEHSANMVARLEEHNAGALLSGGNRGHGSARRGSVDHDIHRISPAARVNSNKNDSKKNNELHGL